MNRIHKIFLVTGFSLIIGSCIFFAVSLAVPNGIRMASPQPENTVGKTFTVTGDAWMRDGIKSIQIIAVSPTGEELVFPAERMAVKYKGINVFLLSWYSVTVHLPIEGSWTIQAVVNGDRQIDTPPRKINVIQDLPSIAFKNWSVQHIIPFLLIILSSAVMGFIGWKFNNKPFQKTISIVLAAIIWVNELVYQWHWYLIGGWSVGHSLIIQMCGLSILFIPVLLFMENTKRRQFFFDILYFWSIGGATQALITPDIGAHGFPSYRFISFFISHGFIIINIIYIQKAKNLSITFKSFVRAVVVTFFLAAAAYPLNLVFKFFAPYDPGNYFVLGYPPPTGSVVDLFIEWFGPSPYYFIGLIAMGIIVFFIIYLPHPIWRWIKSISQKAPK